MRVIGDRFGSGTLANIERRILCVPTDLSVRQIESVGEEAVFHVMVSVAQHLGIKTFRATASSGRITTPEYPFSEHK